MKKELIEKIDHYSELVNENPIRKALVDGGLSLIPFIGPAVSSVVSSRAAELAYKNTKLLLDQVRMQISSVTEDKLDASFIESDEFTAILIKTIEANARNYRHEKIKYYAKLFVAFLSREYSGILFKEGFIQIIEALAPEHILCLAIIYHAQEASVTADYIAGKLHLDSNIVLAYCEQMIRHGLVRDWSIGRWGYKPGKFAITEYGCKLCSFLKS